jgi:hypothetical protein
VNFPIAAGVLFAVVGASTMASAQSGARPYRALFGGAAADPSVHHSLDLSLSVAGVYDDNAAADTGAGSGGAAVSPLLASGFYTSLEPGVTYDWTARRARFSARAGSNLRYYADQQDFVGAGHFGAFDFSAGAGRTQMSVRQSVSYSPTYFYGILPSLPSSEAGSVAAGGGDYALNASQVLVSDTSADVSKSTGPRSSITAFGNYRHASYPGGSTLRPSLQAYGIGGRFNRELSRTATLRLGYTYRKGQYGYSASDRATIAHDIDVGVDYHRPLSFSRRTRFDFGFGSSIINAPLENSTTGELQYRVVGNAGLSHDMGRTWRARLAYNRGVGFVAALGAPIFSDGVIASIDGFANRRVDLHFTGGTAIGDVGRDRSRGTGTKSYTGSARFGVAISRAWAMFGEYLYYDYQLGADVAVLSGVPQSLKRNTARVGLSAWLPVLKR